LTRYNDWAEIARGNVAAAVALGGKVLGAANIMRVAVHTNSGVLDTVLWGLAGMVLLLLTYLAFEWLTPRLDVNGEIAGGNVAVGVLSASFSLALSILVGASIA
jgi:putative membrane protein